HRPSSYTALTVPARAQRTSSPASAARSMPLWVRQSPSVSLYTSSSPLKPAKVCPDTGGTKAGAGEAGGSVGAAGVDCGGCDPEAETDPDEADEEAGGAVGSTGTSFAGFCTG